jgi:hypothetical protein
MQVFIRRSTSARLIGALAALSLSAGSAWAGGGGQDAAANLQANLSALCNLFSMTCPTFTPLTQLVLQVAALENSTPDTVRFQNGVVSTAAINAVDPPAGTTITSRAPDGAPGSATQPSNIAPLAFVSGEVTERGNPDATSFFYAATNGNPPNGTGATGASAISLVFDAPPLLNNSVFAKNQPIATFTIPLVISNNGTEFPAQTTIQIVGGTGCGKASPCFAATATGTSGAPGNFGPVDPAKLGLTVTFQFLPSENRSTPHAVFIVTAPLLVMQKTDPAYFTTSPVYGSLLNLLVFASFGTTDQVPLAQKFLGLPIGFGPVAAPVCASITDGQKLQPAVGAYLSISTASTTYLSAPRGTAVACQ